MIDALFKYGIVPSRQIIFKVRKSLRYDYTSGIDVVKENLQYAYHKLKDDLDIDIKQVPSIISEDSTSLRILL